MFELNKEAELQISTRDALGTLMEAYIYSLEKSQVYDKNSSVKSIDRLKSIMKHELEDTGPFNKNYIRAAFPVMHLFFNRIDPCTFKFESESDFDEQFIAYDKHRKTVYLPSDNIKPFLWAVKCPNCNQKIYIPYVSACCPCCGINGRIEKLSGGHSSLADELRRLAGEENVVPYVPRPILFSDLAPGSREAFSLSARLRGSSEQ